HRHRPVKRRADPPRAAPERAGHVPARPVRPSNSGPSTGPRPGRMIVGTGPRAVGVPAHPYPLPMAWPQGRYWTDTRRWPRLRARGPAVGTVGGPTTIADHTGVGA